MSSIAKTGSNLIFNFDDRLQIESLNQRATRSQVITSNIANAETPGFRALGYDFESQLQDIAGDGEPLKMKVENDRHKSHGFTEPDGTIRAEVYIRPTESYGNDGNTVDLDLEMAQLAQNQILYKAASEIISRKIGMLKYAISGGR